MRFGSGSHAAHTLADASALFPPFPLAATPLAHPLILSPSPSPSPSPALLCPFHSYASSCRPSSASFSHFLHCTASPFSLSLPIVLSLHLQSPSLLPPHTTLLRPTSHPCWSHCLVLYSSISNNGGLSHTVHAIRDSIVQATSNLTPLVVTAINTCLLVSSWTALSLTKHVTHPVINLLIC